MQVTPYLTFNGNCREAMEFYRDCLGGNLYLQTIDESSLSEKMPDELKNCILHAELRKEEFSIMATDLVPETGLAFGNSVSLLLNCNGMQQLHEYYSKLSEKGEQTHFPEVSAFGSIVGNLKDKFGMIWLLHCKPQSNFVSQNGKLNDIYPR